MRTRTIAELIVGITVVIACGVLGYLLWNARRKQHTKKKVVVMMTTKPPVYAVSTMPPTTTAPVRMMMTRAPAVASFQYPSQSWTLPPPAWVASNSVPPSMM